MSQLYKPFCYKAPFFCNRYRPIRVLLVADKSYLTLQAPHNIIIRHHNCTVAASLVRLRHSQRFCHENKTWTQRISEKKHTSTDTKQLTLHFNIHIRLQHFDARNILYRIVISHMFHLSLICGVVDLYRELYTGP